MLPAVQQLQRSSSCEPRRTDPTAAGGARFLHEPGNECAQTLGAARRLDDAGEQYVERSHNTFSDSVHAALLWKLRSTAITRKSSDLIVGPADAQADVSELRYARIDRRESHRHIRRHEWNSLVRNSISERDAGR